MTLAFKKATRKQTKARIAIMGASGSGKTLWSLRIAAGLVGPGGRFAVIDSENRSASLYVGEHGLDFDVLELDPDSEGGFDPRKYVDAMKLAEREGYGAIVVDSLSHAWFGTGGALDQIDKIAGNGNRFAAWKDVTPIQNELTDAITHCRTHVLATLRSKTEYVLEEYEDNKGRKKTKPVRVGLAPVQRQGLEYEFSIFAECDLETHQLKLTKSRVASLDGKVYATAQVATFSGALKAFHDSGESPLPVEPPAPPAAAQKPRAQQIAPTARDRQDEPPPAPAKLPTTTSKNYPEKQWCDVPFESLTPSALAAYLAYYEQRMPEVKQDNHRRAVTATIEAAKAEFARRTALEAEMAAATEQGGETDADDYDPATGEVVANDAFQPEAAGVVAANAEAP